jgi:hypothetical protein
MSLSPVDTQTLLVAKQLQSLGVPWFDDNPYGWQVLQPPTGSKLSAWDQLTVTIMNPMLASSATTSATFYADVVGKLELNIDKKQTPGKNAAKLTVVNLAADEITTVLYLFSPQDLLNYFQLIPSQVMTITRNALLNASATKTKTTPPTVPIVQLTHPAIQLSGRNKFVLKTEGLVIPPRDGHPPMVHLTWVPQEDYIIDQMVITTAIDRGLSAAPGDKTKATAANATSPASVPAANAPSP